MAIASFDHVALPTAKPEEMIDFYGKLGFRVPDVSEWKASGVPFFSVFFGRNRINFHAPDLWQDDSFELRGPTAQPGCGDLCFVWDGDDAALAAMLAEAKAPVELGPIEMEGGRGKATSTYTRDPDGNLLEFIVYP